MNTKTKNHSRGWMTVKNGTLIIEGDDETWEICNKDDWNKFYDSIENGTHAFPDGWVCSSSVDFPEEYGADEELIDIIRNGLGR